MAAVRKDRSPSLARHKAGQTLAVAPASSDSFVLRIQSGVCFHRMILVLSKARRSVQPAPPGGQRHVWRRLTCGLIQTDLGGAVTATLHQPPARVFNPGFDQSRHDVHAGIPDGERRRAVRARAREGFQVDFR